MHRRVVATDSAPRLGLPYCQAIEWNGLVFVAGQVGIDPTTGRAVSGGIEAQTERVLENIKAILEAAGTSLDLSLESICFLANIGDFARFNEVYRRYFPKDGPPRTTVQAALPLDGLLVEIRIVACMPEAATTH